MHAESRNPQTGREIAKLISLVMLAQVLALFCRSWFQIQLKADGMPVWPATNLSYLIVPPVLLLILYPVWAHNGSSVWRTLQFSRLTLRTAAVGLTLGIALRLANWGIDIVRTAMGWTAVPLQSADVYVQFVWPPLAFIGLHLLVMAILIPLTEEVINRGWIATWLRRYGALAAMSGSAALFAILHSGSGMLNAFVFGLLAARLYFLTGTLWGPVLAHATFNSLIILDTYCLTASPIFMVLNSGNLVAAIMGASLASVSGAVCIAMVSNRITGLCTR